MTEEIKEEIQEEYEVNEIVYESYLASAYYALNAIDGIDVEMVSSTDKSRIKAIKRKSLRIIHECISVMHDELFGDESE